ncbi:uncharacterized protein METZ01_LOCUS318274 [marine metagenome]|uniref:CdiI immunity protein domain-containing protein n=1 Tax=marine metagenome TaxID=408172 RepID=A0A382NXQ8_9ZZZZ
MVGDVMSRMKNFIMDIEEFCDGYFYGGDSEFTIEEVVADVGMYFKSTEAEKYAKTYLKKTLGEV